MTTEVQIFNHPEFGGVRIIGDADDPYFCLSDVCRILGLQAAAVMRRLDDGVTTNHPIIDSLGRTQTATFVNEDGLYDVILDSRKPAAKKFRKWLTSEVIPSIRKTGIYINPNAAINPDLLIKIANDMKALQAERDAALTQVAELQPKADYCQRVLESDEALTVTLIAKDYGMSAAEFNEMLREYRIQYKVGRVWHLYQPYSAFGYMVTGTVEVGEGKFATQTYWTQKGRMYLYNELKKHGVVPICEREKKTIELFGEG